MGAVSVPGRPGRRTRGLLAAGLATGPVFVATFLIEGAVREGYQPSRQPVSSLALGPRGWIQGANFIVAGTLMLAGAAGLRQARAPVGGTRAVTALIGVAGIGLFGSAVFPTDPVSGYPPGTPAAPAAPTRSGLVHNLSAIPVFAGLSAAAFTCGWQYLRAGQRGAGLYCAATAATVAATSVAAGAGFGQSPRMVNRAGLFQRASIVAGFGWVSVLAGRALLRPPATRMIKKSA